MLIFYDFEVFKFDWLVIFIIADEERYCTIINDEKMLHEFYKKYKDCIFVGYNNKHYDQYIFSGILAGFDPYDINNFIIAQNNAGWMYSKELYNFPTLQYDVGSLADGGLKSLEAFMGNNIKETSVPFDIDRKLTDDEIKETVYYCTHDVEQTIEVFQHRINDFNAILSLITTFKLPLTYISKTKPQLSAIILDCEKTSRYDEWDISIVPTLKLSKYNFVKAWFLEQIKSQEYGSPLKCEIAGVPHSFGWGGAHGARAKYHSKGLIIHVDVTSYYPSLMIEYNLLTRNSRKPEQYKQIYDTRVALKKAGKKAEQAPYKIVLNGTFGICKDKNSIAYDPRQANNICINGQLLLIDLIEKLEVINGFELIQSNTDGLIIKIPDTDDAFNQCDNVCFEWEQRTRMGLGFDTISEIWQKDVNNYVFKFTNGEIERKGSYVQELNDLKYDLAIVNTACIEFMLNKIPVEDTIHNCDDMRKFQKVVKVSSKYSSAWHNGKKLQDKCHRVFASADIYDGMICKQKRDGANLEKFANTPEHCFIYNDAITEDLKLPIDKDYYINIAYERLKDYGVI